MFRKTAPTIAMVGVLTGAAAVALGRPDFGAAGDVLSGRSGSTDGVLALVSILTWLVILAALSATVIYAVRTVHHDGDLASRPWARSMLFLAAGLTVLGVGAAHHAAASASLCCGNTSEAVQLGR